jgi:ParB-like chromosome segregation protein Spo0J
MKFTTIEITDIDLADDRFRISYTGPSEDLVASIEATGLLNPPLVALRDGGTLVVCGWKRILACEKLGIPSLPVFVAPEMSDLELFKHPVYENVSFRELAVFEKAVILNKLKDFGEQDEDLIRKILPLLKVPATRRYLDLFLDVSKLDPEIRQAWDAKGIALPVLELYLKFSPQEQAALLPILLPLGQNKQRELLSQLLELAGKQKSSPQAILLGMLYQTILQDENLSALQKSDRILNLLREQRNPVLSQWTQAFDAALRSINLEKGICINPVPYFEGEELSLCFGFKSREEFLQKLAELTKAAEAPEFSDLFHSLSEDE